MRPHSLSTCFFSIIIMVVGPTLGLATVASATTVELPTALHFLNPVGEDVQIGPGLYQVETAESWLKLIPAGKGPIEAVLLEATFGIHNEALTESVVRLKGEGEKSDVFHLAMLLVDGAGLEAVGTTSGIRPRGLNLMFMKKSTSRSMRFTQRSRVSRKSLPRVAVRPGHVAPQAKPDRLSPASGKSVDCGPYQKEIGSQTGNRAPSLVVFRKQLHVVATNFTDKKWWVPSFSYQFGGYYAIEHWIYNNETWSGNAIPDQLSKSGVGLAAFQDRLHMVHLGKKSNDLWYSTFNGQEWTTNVKILGQKSKATPALATWNNQLHMVHLGDKSNQVWHSINKGKGWTVNSKVPYAASTHTPALGRVPNGPYKNRLHMVFKNVNLSNGRQIFSLSHAQFNGRQWRKGVTIPVALTKAAPTLVSSYPYGMHLFHVGKSSDNLWHMFFGPNTKKNNTVEWFDDRRFLSEKSEAPVTVVLFQGCYHMVSAKGNKLIHTTFSPTQVHPTVR